MKLVLLKDKLFEKREGFSVGDQKINALQGYLEITKKEKKKVIKKAEDIWKNIFEKSGMDYFEGHVRFDFIPKFKGKARRKGSEIRLGEISIKGIYEVNTHSPEGVACDALYRRKFPEISSYTPSAGKQLAKKLLETYDSKLTMVRGSNLAKSSWASAFLDELSANGLNVSVNKWADAQKNPPSTLWRWGDVDFKGEFNEYSDDFQKWLYKAQNNYSRVINTIPESRNADIANKKLLASEEDIVLNSNHKLEKAMLVDKDNYVLKPLRGASGKGILFGEDVSKDKWRIILRKATKKGDYGIFEKILLPKIEVNNLSITMDLLPSFFANGKDLTYLYSLVRVEPWESYFSRKTINVAQGGGYGGTLKEVKES
ncbi:MAG: hypothetical protein ACQEP3_01680 [Patescibacteria group bacterium]